jgi:hypothetical protein
LSKTVRLGAQAILPLWSIRYTASGDTGTLGRRQRSPFQFGSDGFKDFESTVSQTHMNRNPRRIAHWYFVDCVFGGNSCEQSPYRQVNVNRERSRCGNPRPESVP